LGVLARTYYQRQALPGGPANRFERGRDLPCGGGVRRGEAARPTAAKGKFPLKSGGPFLIGVDIAERESSEGTG
jgi:hypothetical protein